MDQTTATRTQGQNPSDERGEPSFSAITAHLPQFWDQHPSARFLQAESQFQVAGIRSQASKFHYAVAELSPTAIDEVADLLNAPLSTTAYDDIKAAPLQRTTASQRFRIQQLLFAEELGNRRPSQLLCRMRQLLGNNARSIDDALLRELFLQRLPASVQMVLATAATMDLTGLAALADKVMEVATPTIAATTSYPGDNTTALQTLPCSSAAQSPLDSLCERLWNASSVGRNIAARHLDAHAAVVPVNQDAQAPAMKHQLQRLAFATTTAVWETTLVTVGVLALGRETGRPPSIGDEWSGPAHKSPFLPDGQSYRPTVLSRHRS